MSGRPYEIRCAGLGDLDEASRLYERVATETLFWVPREMYAASNFLIQASEETVWVAVADGRIIGLAALYEPQNFLHSLYIDRDWQGQGVGLALLNTVRDAASGPLRLKAEMRNVRALAFYARHGFEEEVRGRANGSEWIQLLLPHRATN